MLRKFMVTNYKNFRETLCVDFTKVHDYKYNEYCIRDNLINKMIIYGKNAEGKSNLGSAIFDIVNDINYSRNPYFYRDDRHLYRNADTPDDEVVKFYYSFQFENDIIIYEYNKINATTVVYEKLTVNDKIIFYYDLLLDKYDFSNVVDINAEDLNWQEFISSSTSINKTDVEETRPTALRYIIYNTIQNDGSTISKLAKFIKGMRFTDSSSHRFPVRLNMADYFETDEDLKRFENFLNNYGVKCNLILLENVEGKKELYFDYKKPLHFTSNLSSGTMSLTRFYLQHLNKNKPSFIYMDEFDAFYHFELSEKIVELLEKEFECQVVLTSHNTNLLSNSIMRPDCFMILNNGTLTPLCEATNRELRQGHNLEKLYMNGEFDE